MNPTPTIVQVIDTPQGDFTFTWILFAVACAIIGAFYAQRYQDRKNAQRQLDEVKAKADEEVSDFRRARIELQTACLRCDRADLIVPRHKSASEVVS